MHSQPANSFFFYVFSNLLAHAWDLIALGLVFFEKGQPRRLSKIQFWAMLVLLTIDSTTFYQPCHLVAEANLGLEHRAEKTV